MAILKFSDKKNAKYANENAIDNVIYYIFDQNKLITPITGGIGVDLSSKNQIIDQFYFVQKFHSNCHNKRIFHFIVSFSNSEMEKLTTKDFVKIGYGIATFFPDEYQIVFALHEDHANYHFHYALNPVSILTGKKIRWQKKLSINLFQHIQKEVQDRI